jgi:diguanylate cyclase (GGDEF)-like protein/PAS domain S-box-containing protein
VSNLDQIQSTIGLIATLLLIALAIFTVFVFRSCQTYRRKVRELSDSLTKLSGSHSLDGRVETDADDPELTQLAAAVNKLLNTTEVRSQKSARGEKLFSDLTNVMPEIVLIHDDNILFANREAGELLGLPANELIGRKVTDLIRPAYRSTAENVIRQQLDGKKKRARYELQLIDGEQRTRWAEATGMRIGFRGKPVLLTIARDISYRKSVEATLSQGRRQAQTTLESLGEGIVTADTQGRIDYMNSSAEKLVGINREQALGKQFGDVVNLIDEGDRQNLGDPISRCLEKRQNISLGRRALLMPSDGDNEVSIDASASPIMGPDDSVIGAVLIMRDVGELRGLAREMTYQASHDALTGLFNRPEFERNVTLALNAAKESDDQHVLCFLDLDRFKTVNDTVGHMAGDNMLREVASLIRQHVRDSDVVARLGGDEFGLLLLKCPLDKARQITEDICAGVREYRFTWQDQVFDVGVSIGVVEIAHASSSLEDLLGAADSACYVAKQQGRGQVHVYSVRDEAGARQRGEIHWLRKLQNAIRDKKFELYVQPIISVSGRIPSGPAMEVLLRMDDADEGLILPSRFIRAAERYQLMGELDRWVVETTLASIGSGAIRLPDERSVAINLSGQTMADADFLDFVVNALDHSQVAPAKLCFEVTESAVLRDFEHAKRFIDVLHGMGCYFALDDFGSDIGSLSSVQGLSIDFLKLDGTYTRDLNTNVVNQEVVVSVTRLSRALGFKVVAEQVEDQNSFDTLRDLGVDFIQGNFVDEPHGLGG